MSDDQAPRDFAAAWRPQRPGRRGFRDIVDAIVEPVWGGVRVVAALTADEATIVRDGEAVDVPDELPPALVEAFTATGAVVEGNLTTMALRSNEGVIQPLPKIERPPLLIPRGIRKPAKNDPFVRAREAAQREAALATTVLDALARGERHVFVATDLLWLDGTPLAGVPLLERKRLLDSVLVPSFLVRVTPFVKPTATPTLVTWGAQGFAEVSYRAANSFYLAGEENPEWAVCPPPEGPQGPSRGPVSPR